MHAVFGTPFPAGRVPQHRAVRLSDGALRGGRGFRDVPLILWRLRKHTHAEGRLLGVYLVLAGIERFLVEFFRAKDDRFFGGLTLAQRIALGVMAIGFGWIYARRAEAARTQDMYAEA